jgi:hypothetical protein
VYEDVSIAAAQEWWDKASCLAFVQNSANNFDYYISKP